MLDRSSRIVAPRLIFDSTELDDRLLNIERVGDEGIPLLTPSAAAKAPTTMVAFDRFDGRRTTEGVAIHFFVDDHKLPRLLRAPDRYAVKFGEAAAVLTPDFSLYRDMRRHQRVGHVYLNRSIGAIFSLHGLRVIPSIRWAVEADFDFCFDGVARGSVVAISMHGCSRSPIDRDLFRIGLVEMLDRLCPVQVLVHGPRPASVFGGLHDRAEFTFYEAEITERRRRPRPITKTGQLSFDQIDAGPEVGSPGMSFM